MSDGEVVNAELVEDGGSPAGAEVELVEVSDAEPSEKDGHCVCAHPAGMHTPAETGPLCHGCMWEPPGVRLFPHGHPFVPEPGPVYEHGEPLGPLEMILHAMRESR